LRARLALAQGVDAEARAHSSQLVAIARREVVRGSTPGSLQALANAQLLDGMVASASGDAAAARSAYSAALLAWPKGLAETPLLTSTKVVLLEGLGRMAEAKQAAARLEVIGYRHPTYLRDVQLIRKSGRTA
jgi:hypothetical protein